MAQINAYLNRKASEVTNQYFDDFLELYSFVPNSDLQKIFASLHTKINELFEVMNHDIGKRCDKDGDITYTGGYFHAPDSRAFLDVVDNITDFREKLGSTEYAFFIDSIYDNGIKRCLPFIGKYRGSTIPEGLEPIEIIDLQPIFHLNKSVAITKNEKTIYANMRSVGGGSYASVFSYMDPFYQTPVALKRAKADLDEKELKRFRQEFEVLKSLKSPYIVKVYAYNTLKNEYTMELMDESLHKYILRENTILGLIDRKKIIWQISHGLEHIHQKKLLHRDISLTNILVNHYEGVNIVKIVDFGLVKIPDSTLTSIQSEIKGSLNDPDLINVGFSNYTIHHETYALTRLCFFILTGRTNIDRQKDGEIKRFWQKGTSPDINNRFKSVSEIADAIQKITDSNK